MSSNLALTSGLLGENAQKQVKRLSQTMMDYECQVDFMLQET